MSDSALGGRNAWSLRIEPRHWQTEALGLWTERLRGVVSVVTGGGKTLFAFMCMRAFRDRYLGGRVVILVPTMTLLDQWYVSLREDFGLQATEIACFSSQERARSPRAVNVLVINSARTMIGRIVTDATFVVVDECHRAGSPENAKALKGPFVASLGLSATPQREYDAGFEEHVVPALGPVIFEYDYSRARADDVVAPFALINVRVDMEPHEQSEYNKLTKRAALLLRQMRAGTSAGDSHEKLKRVLQMRAAVSATALMRLPVAAKIVDENRGARTLVFHERIASANALCEMLQKRKHSVCVYHARVAPEVRRDNLRLFRRGVFDVLISCRALDEGTNVPETTLAVIASSTSSGRQRIQRLGRVLRPAKGKVKAEIYTIYATEQERQRLEREEERLEGVATVLWTTGTRRQPKQR